ncbi:MAG TPA: TonB-dependent receptor [Candidatus Limnocylindrales bacterium]|nr:TonB-dependent receptor [Candidatus Limnocylindrales bacterium]
MTHRHLLHCLRACAIAALVPATAFAQPQPTLEDIHDKQRRQEQQPQATQPDASVEEILVTGTSVTTAIDQARFSESIMDVLDAEDFAVTGDSGVVDALARVTGVTTVGDKYVFVRGLAERYSNTLFNFANLPSPDPVRRVVPLDLFPAGVMEQLSVQKTYAPYLPAEFSGGSVQLTTRAIPRERMFRLSLSTDFNDQTTFTDKTWLEGSSTDWSGFDGDHRDLPAGVPEGTDPLDGLSAEKQREIGLALRREYDLRELTLPPGFKLASAYANRFDTRIGDMGFILGLQAEDDWQYRKEHRQIAVDEIGTIGDRTTQKETENTIQYSILGSGEWSPLDSHRLKGTLFYTHLTSKRFIREDPRYSNDNDRYFYVETSEWEQQSLLTAQLEGDHSFSLLGDLGARWGLTYATAERVKPDTRQYTFDAARNKGCTDAADRPSGRPSCIDPTGLSTDVSNQRTWEDLSDNAWDAHLDLERPFKLSSAILSTLKGGAKYYNKQRQSEQRRFRFLPLLSPDDYVGLPVDDAFADDKIGPPNGWLLFNTTTPTDIYEGQEDILGVFLQTDIELGDQWRLTGGARWETSTQSIDMPLFPEANAELRHDGFFPAAELTWLFREDMQLRAAWSQTVNRPDLRELSAAEYIDPEDRNIYFGNSNLQVAELTNYDLRWEWYHDTSDSVQLAFFYKDLKSPIEERYLTSGSRRTWENADQGWLYGIELAFRQSLHPLGRHFENFHVRANGSWIQSEVEVPVSADVIDKRPLQGQSDWIVNAQLTYDDLPRALQATLAFNMAGPRIDAVGDPLNGLDDLEEQSFPVLDFVLKKTLTVFDHDLDFTLKARNLINARHEFTRDGVTERGYYDGRTFTIELAKDF